METPKSYDVITKWAEIISHIEGALETGDLVASERVGAVAGGWNGLTELSDRKGNQLLVLGMTLNGKFLLRLPSNYGKHREFDSSILEPLYYTARARAREISTNSRIESLQETIQELYVMYGEE
jgi:hypothetical protein